MIPIYIASTTGYAGRTFIALGLAMKLQEQGYRVGYIKPVGRTPVRMGRDIVDADALFVQETLGLGEPLDTLSPFVLTYETQTLLLDGSLRDVKGRILTAYRSLKDKDFVIISGAGNLFAGSLLGASALTLIEDMDARLLMAEPWRGDMSPDAIFGLSQLIGKRFCGSIINKVPANTLSHVRDTVRPFLETKGIEVFGVFPKDQILEAVTVRQVIDLLNGKVLCCEDRIDEYVENFSIGAMDVDSALNYFRRTPNKAVITGAYRSDIQLAAMETSTRCIILTGGFTTNDVVIGKAEAKGVPIITVTDDTFTTIDKIEGSLGKTNIRDKRKVARIRELIDGEFDLDRFLQCVK